MSQKDSLQFSVDFEVPTLSAEAVLDDYRVACLSREVSLLGRREVLSGRAKFGIFGDGKELAQIALAKAFKLGDWKAGYYRDQTFMFATKILTPEQFFAQLYADTDLEREPHSKGRQMNSHFATRFYNQGEWLDQTQMINVGADLSPTAAQMIKLLGFAYASKLYRNLNIQADKYSRQGGEVAFGTIGDASTSEGIFWESINAAGVLQVPLVMSVWDDGYGISVPKKYQTVHQSISRSLSGMEWADGSGLHIFRVKGWDYPQLLATYQKAAEMARRHHQPVLIHVEEITQPQGHSTSGSHERYKPEDRLSWEKTFDANLKFRDWIIAKGFADEDQLSSIEAHSIEIVKQAKESAWKNSLKPIEEQKQIVLEALQNYREVSCDPSAVFEAYSKLDAAVVPSRRLILKTSKDLILSTSFDYSVPERIRLVEIYKSLCQKGHEDFDSFETPHQKVLTYTEPLYSPESKVLDGSQIIRHAFDHLLAKCPSAFIIGEDVGHLGGVNTEFEGLQEKYGLLRVSDTGIREASIFGQGMGSAMRGLRPIVDIQYLDYVLYCLQPMSDDLASLHYRTAGGQVAPVIIRTKGHRLEGIWHTGSPMGTILHSIRGINFCVPRDMVRALGMYNTLIELDTPSFVCEVLNGYRLKEILPDNFHDFKLEIGKVDILTKGESLTLVTYGACVRIAQEAVQKLALFGIHVELIDVQTLLPFDKYSDIARSIRKTNAVLFLDEDVPGGASAYMMREVLERDGAYQYLDASPRTLTAKAHRGAYASDGDYFSKPNAEQIFDACYKIMQERDPFRFPDTVAL